MRVITFKQLATEKGITFCRVHLRRLTLAGEFPQPIHIGLNKLAWLESEIDEWLAKKAAEREVPDARAA